MARRRLVPIVLLVLLAAAGCSDDDSGEPTPSSSGSGSGSTASGAPTSSPTSATSTEPTVPVAEGGIALTGPNGSGSLVYSLSPETSEFCYRMEVEGIGDAEESQVQRAGGEVVLALRAPTEASIDTCVATDALLIQEMQTRPSSFTVQVTGSEGVLTATLE